MERALNFRALRGNTRGKRPSGAGDPPGSYIFVRVAEMSSRQTERRTRSFPADVRPVCRLLLPLALLLIVACGGHPQPGTTASQQLAFGVEMAKRGLWNEALFRFRQADSLNPNDGRILNNLAVAYEATGQFEQALDTYRTAIDLAGSSEELRANYSRFSEFYATYRAREQGAASGDGEESGGEAEGEAATEEAADEAAAPSPDEDPGEQEEQEENDDETP